MGTESETEGGTERGEERLLSTAPSQGHGWEEVALPLEKSFTISRPESFIFFPQTWSGHDSLREMFRHDLPDGYTLNAAKAGTSEEGGELLKSNNSKGN